MLERPDGIRVAGPVIEQRPEIEPALLPIRFELEGSLVISDGLCRLSSFPRAGRAPGKLLERLPQERGRDKKQ